MWINIGLLLCAVHIFTKECCGGKFLELPGFQSDGEARKRRPTYPEVKLLHKEPYYPSRTEGKIEYVHKNKVWPYRGQDRGPMFKSNPKYKKRYDGKINADDKVRPVKERVYYGDGTDGKTKRGNKVWPFRAEERQPVSQSYPKYKNHDSGRTDGKNKVDDERRYQLVSDDPTEPSQTTIKPSSPMTTVKPVNLSNPDEVLKLKILTLVDQSLYDTQKQIASIQYVKDHNGDIPSYQVGYVMNLIKKKRDIMNEMFNIAVKNRDEWKAMEQMKAYEWIVHTNVDTTHLVQTLVEIHLRKANATSTNTTSTTTTTTTTTTTNTTETPKRWK